jgi:replicative DNA helicase
MTRPLMDDSAERAVLGAILVRNAAMDEVSDSLDPEQFGKGHHEAIYAAMVQLHRAGTAIDALTICAELERRGALDGETRAYVYGLDMGVPRSTNVTHYAALVKEKYTLRRVREEARRLITAAEAEDAISRDLLESAEQSIYKLGSDAIKTNWISSAELADELEPLLDQMLRDRQPVTGVATGYRELDTMTRGFQPADLILLGARPSQGKTAFGIGVSLRAAEQVPVAVFSYRNEPARHRVPRSHPRGERGRLPHALGPAVGCGYPSRRGRADEAPRTEYLARRVGAGDAAAWCGRSCAGCRRAWGISGWWSWITCN